MNRSGIEWTDYTWSPVTGCSKVSAGCKHCYAEAWHKRFRGGDFSVRLHFNKLDDPLRSLRGFALKHLRRPRVFVCPMADLFHAEVPDEFIEQVWSRMAMSNHIDFIVLTKRPSRMEALLSSECFRNMADDVQYPLPNVWIGVTVENQEAAEQRIPILLQTPAAVRWVSVEPMLGPVDLNVIVQSAQRTHRQGGLDWVVCGGESGAGARPMETEWVRSLRDQCRLADIPFFLKQWGPQGGPLCDGLPVLDGIVHNAFPQAMNGLTSIVVRAIPEEL